MSSRLLLCLCALLLTGAQASADTVPSWFKPDAENAGAIFSAWKNLSTREAVLYWGGSWTVLGGQLRDKEGKPLALAPLGISYHDGIRGFGANLITDKDGYFLIYSPYSLDVRGPANKTLLHGRYCLITVAPGYPATPLGMAYAAAKQEARLAEAQPLLLEADRAFYSLTVDGSSTFDERSFEAYKVEALTKQPYFKTKPFRDLTRRLQVSTEDRKRTAYKLKILSPDGRPVPNALVKYQAYDGYEGNIQAVETDEAGICEVEEYLLTGKDAAYYSGINRTITLDAPGLAVGPVTTPLKEGVVNDIPLQAPARVVGRVVDHRGEPVWMYLSVEYRRPNLLAFEADIRQRPDGSFSFERIMPGEEFKVKARGTSRQTTPRAPVETDYMTLAPGEERTINFHIPLAAALRLLVTNAQGQSVKGEVSLTLLFEDGNQWSGFPDRSGHGRFGFYALGQVPFRVQIKAHGFQDYLSEPLKLEPGELRFMRLTLAARKEFDG
jgi:hypothetical protein